MNLSFSVMCGPQNAQHRNPQSREKLLVSDRPRLLSIKLCRSRQNESNAKIPLKKYYVHWVRENRIDYVRENGMVRRVL